MNIEHHIKNLAREMEQLEIEIRRHGMILASFSSPASDAVGDLSCPPMAETTRETFRQYAAYQ